ncbi:MAG TPA: VIT1/CCC1 transporter family protein [Acidimicrobiia bacterium]|nr:VIT1/CCC1 transporter family protein [Acidimicrobiia bacterium]
MTITPERLALFEAMREDELDAAALYRALADTAQGRRRDVLNRLAEAEERHAGHWERLLREAGVTEFPRLKRTWRTKVLSAMARRFGADSVLPLVLRLEAADAAKYRDVAEAGATMSAEEEAHGRAVAALGGSDKGEQILRAEGRHRAAAGGALRAGVFGVNDGLLSNLLLIVGVAGGTGHRAVILLAGLVGLLAGAFSMAAGEWVSVQSQKELYEREISIEREELAAFPEEELNELILIYQAKGLSDEEAQVLARRIIARPESALDTLTREELGLAPGALDSPWVAATSSFAAFGLGAFIPVVPFLAGSGGAALGVAILLSAGSLFAVGAAVALLTGRNPLRGGLRQVVIAGLVGIVVNLLGRLIGSGVSV